MCDRALENEREIAEVTDDTLLGVLLSLRDADSGDLLYQMIKELLLVQNTCLKYAEKLRGILSITVHHHTHRHTHHTPQTHSQT